MGNDEGGLAESVEWGCRMKKNRGCLVAVLAVTAILLINLLMWGLGPGVVADDAIAGSSFSNAPTGMRGLALMYEHFGYEIAQRRSTFEDTSDLNPNQDVIFIACTYEPFTNGEIERLGHWVRSGGRLVMIEPLRGDVMRALVPGLERSRNRQNQDPVDSCLIHVSPEGTPLIENQSWPIMVSPFVDEVSTVTTPDSTVFSRPGIAAPAAAISDFAFTMLVSHSGHGQVVAFSSNPFINSALSTSDNARLALNLASGAKRVVFDEYHHGYRQSGGSIQALPIQWRWALLGLVIAVITYAWARAPRRSAPAEEPPVLPRTRGEFIGALALSLQRANGSQTAVRILQNDLRMRLQRRLFMGGWITDEEIVAASPRLGLVPGEIATALRPIPTEDRALLERAQQITRLRREL